MKLILICIVSYFLNPAYSFAQLKLHQFEEIDSLQKVEKRKVVVFINTDWCKYCAIMKNTTLKDKNIIELLNHAYYFISFNAEEKRTIFFNKKTFNYLPTGNNVGTHHLAIELATVNDKISYPTFCFLNADYEIVFQAVDFKNKSEFKMLLEKIK